ncbi:hypothetical protein IBZ12_01885 [Serratia ureilytica]|uniref:hypothetical protein n=1 Tax=Serratia ureilytica TaxID=300181 RepID=UPI0039B5BB7C
MKVIYFFINATPLLGRGAVMPGKWIFSLSKERFTSALNRDVNKLATAPYIVLDDDTEADDIEKLSLDAFFIVCAPGLNYQFYRGKFDKRRVLYLTTMEFHTNDTRSVIRTIKEIEQGNECHQRKDDFQMCTASSSMLMFIYVYR